MKILVTGGAGFIGSHLVDRLLAEGNQVTVIDNLNTGKKENLDLKNPNLTFYHADILDGLNFFMYGIDVVFHLAALTRPQWSIEHPIESNMVNVQGTLNIFKMAHENKVKRVVFASSSSLYGIQDVFPTPENAPVNTMSPYGLQKWMGEEYAMLFQRMYQLQVNCIRPFNVYGTRQNPTGGYAAAVPKFIDSLKKDQKCFITGNGEQSRDFTYVDDIVDMFVKASESKVSGHSFNAGGGESISINKLYEIISKLMKKDLKPEHIEAVYEPFRTLADTSKARLLLGWKPSVTIEEGLRKTVEGILNG